MRNHATSYAAVPVSRLWITVVSYLAKQYVRQLEARLRLQRRHQRGFSNPSGPYGEKDGPQQRCRPFRTSTRRGGRGLCTRCALGSRRRGRRAWRCSGAAPGTARGGACIGRNARVRRRRTASLTRVAVERKASTAYAPHRHTANPTHSEPGAATRVLTAGTCYGRRQRLLVFSSATLVFQGS